jgi:hypothetical protein
MDSYDTRLQPTYPNGPVPEKIAELFKCIFKKTPQEIQCMYDRINLEGLETLEDPFNSEVSVLLSQMYPRLSNKQIEMILPIQMHIRSVVRRNSDLPTKPLKAFLIECLEGPNATIRDPNIENGDICELRYAITKDIEPVPPSATREDIATAFHGLTEEQQDKVLAIVNALLGEMPLLGLEKVLTLVKLAQNFYNAKSPSDPQPLHEFEVDDFLCCVRWRWYSNYTGKPFFWVFLDVIRDRKTDYGVFYYENRFLF